MRWPISFDSDFHTGSAANQGPAGRRLQEGQENLVRKLIMRITEVEVPPLSKLFATRAVTIPPPFLGCCSGT